MSLDSVTEYALSFSVDAVHLQRRDRPAGQQAGAAPPAWRHLGSVEFDAPDFRGDFIRLRQMAGDAGRASGEAGADAPLPVTLIIPDDQILYTTLTVPPGADREQAVARALDGLTPYAIEDLSFDWDGTGDSVRVAAVARQTLGEARDFAAQYGFAGREFRAAPKPETYSSEPVFLLEAPRPVRAAVDPAQVSVIAPDLLIDSDDEADGQEDAGKSDAGQDGAGPDAGDKNEAGQGVLDLDLGGDNAEPAEAEEGKPAEVAELPASDVAEPSAETAKPSQEVSENKDSAGQAGPEAPIAAEPEVSEPKPAVQVAPEDNGRAEEAKAEADRKDAPDSDAPKEAAAPDQPAAAPVDAAPGQAADDDAAPAMAAAAIAESGPAKPAPKAPPVVRHAPDAARPALNPRARAVHLRAAEARNVRPADAAASPVAQVGGRGGLLGLIAMLAALVVGLVLIWAFVVPEPRLADPAPADSAPQQSAELPPAAPQETPPADSAAADAQVTPAATVPDAPEVATAALPDAQPDPMPEQAAAPVTEEPAPETALTAQAEPAQVEPTPNASALTAEERRRVIVAAAAVAAAVVPPSASQPAPPADSAAVDGAAVDGTAATETATPPAARPEIVATQTASDTVSASDARPVRTPQQEAVERALRAAVEGSDAAPAPAETRAAPAGSAVRLTSSARPQLAPRRSTPRTSEPRADTAPAVPTNPLPYEAVQRRVQPASSARPPARAPRPAPAATPASQPAQSAAPVPADSAQTAAAPQSGTGSAGLRGSARPPLRPEGAAPELIEAEPGQDQGALLAPAEQRHLRELIRDLDMLAPPRTRAGTARPLPGAMLAQARPVPKPANAQRASDAISPSAIEAAVRSATDSPPDKPRTAAASAAPARDSGGLLRGSDRPRARPASLGGAVAGLSDKAVEAAISAAVDASAATPGGVQLSALNSSPLPPRRSGGRPAQNAPAAPAAAPSDPSASELAARRKLDEQLQAQAEARVRARAAADAKAEADARAAAEARARAQAEAEERAARAKRQDYKPPEIDNEPEIAGNARSKGATSAQVAKAATEPRGLDMGRTTIIGIIGAGKGSRALIRLRNGKIVTVRLGDRINDGRITAIGNGRLTYVKGGRTHELRLLDGR